MGQSTRKSIRSVGGVLNQLGTSVHLNFALTETFLKFSQQNYLSKS